MLSVKIGKYVGSCVYRRSYLPCPPPRNIRLVYVRTYVRVTREQTVVLLLLLLCTGMEENIPEVFVTLPCQHAG